MEAPENLHQQYRSIESDSSKVDIRYLISIIIDKWYIFIISILLFLAVGFFYLKTQPQIYETNASILIRVRHNAPEELFLSSGLGINLSGKSRRDDEIGIIKSHQIVANVISKLELNTTYRRKKKLGIYSPDLYNESPLYVRMDGVDPEDIPGTIELIFTPSTQATTSEQDKTSAQAKTFTQTTTTTQAATSAQAKFNVAATYFLQGKKRTKEVTIVSLPGFIDLEIGRFYVAREDVELGMEPLKVTISNALEVASNYIKDLKVDNDVKRSTLLYMVLKTDNREKGKDFISALISEYNIDAAKDKNISAYNTSLFIEQRIREVGEELGEIESKVENFRQENEVIELEKQVGFYIGRGEEYQSRRLVIETQLNLLSFIREYITDPKNNEAVAPSLGIKDRSLIALIDEYNSLLIERARIETSTSAENPVLKEINRHVGILKESIITSISNELRASEIALANLNLNERATDSKIARAPAIGRQFTTIAREQKIKSNLFKYLLKKREQSLLNQATISPKAKIITKPYSKSRAIGLGKILILGGFFLAGLIIPAIFLFTRDYFQTKIAGPEELEKLENSFVVGNICKAPAPLGDTPTSLGSTPGGYSLVVKANESSVVAEMFRTLRSNLLFMALEREENIILVTSTIPKEGKTFVSVNLAYSLSLLEKKVLLIGADLRNPQIHNALNIPKNSTGLSSYLAGHVLDYHELIERVDNNLAAGLATGTAIGLATGTAADNAKTGLYIMQAGAIPPNPNELLSGEKLGQFLNQIKSEFDYILIDSAPVGVVSDTFLIARHTHATIYVVRENFSEKDTILFINNIAQDKRLKNVGVVLNQTTSTALAQL